MVTRFSSAQSQLATYSRVFADLTDPIIVEDMEGNILDMNREAERAYGWSQEELLNHPVKMLVPTELHFHADDLLTRCRLGETVRNEESVRRDKLGQTHWVLLTLSLLTDQTDEPFGIVSIAKDITDLKQTAGKLRRAERVAKSHAAELERSNGKLREFVRICSHDLHAPLRGIIGMSDLLRRDCRGKLTETADTCLDHIADGVARMQQLIDGLLEYAKSDSQELARELTNCDDILEDAMANLEADLTQANATVTHDPLPDVNADAMQLLHVFQNLLSNAIKYAEAEPPAIHINAKKQDGECVFSVRDNGIGIESDKLTEIFKPFERLHSADDFEGSGIGLATCQRAVQRHGGRIWAESTVGSGSEFFFTIPCPDEE